MSPADENDRRLQDLLADQREERLAQAIARRVGWEVRDLTAELQAARRAVEFLTLVAAGAFGLALLAVLR